MKVDEKEVFYILREIEISGGWHTLEIIGDGFLGPDCMGLGHLFNQGPHTFYIRVGCSVFVLSCILENLRHVLGECAEVPERRRLVELARGHGLQGLLGCPCIPTEGDPHPIFAERFGSLFHSIFGLGRSQDHQGSGETVSCPSRLK